MTNCGSFALTLEDPDEEVVGIPEEVEDDGLDLLPANALRPLTDN